MGKKQGTDLPSNRLPVSFKPQRHLWLEVSFQKRCWKFVTSKKKSYKDALMTEEEVLEKLKAHAFK